MARTPRFLLATFLSVVSGIALLAQASQPPQTRHLRANGTELSYVDQGRGSPVVFVHGAVSDLRFWEPQREAFAKRHRFIAYTYRYHGTAPWTDDGKQYTPEIHATDLAAFLNGLKAGPVHLVGLSYGGFVAAMVATKDPQLVRSLTLAEPALFNLLADLPEGKPALDAWTKGTGPILAALKAGDSLGATKQLSALVNGEPADSFDKLPAALRQVLSDNARTLGPLFAAAQVNISCDALRAVKIPTLVVRGARTPEIFSKTAELVGRCIEGSRLLVVPDASHTISYQNPTGFNRVVLEFVSKN